MTVMVATGSPVAILTAVMWTVVTWTAAILTGWWMTATRTHATTGVTWTAAILTGWWMTATRTHVTTGMTWTAAILTGPVVTGCLMCTTSESTAAILAVQWLITSR